MVRAIHCTQMVIVTLCILHRFADSVHAFVQPSRQAPASKVVYAINREKQEEVLSGAHHHHPHSKAKNVLISRVERLQNCLQKVICTSDDSQLVRVEES